MVGKDDELGDIDDESLARVKLIADKKKQLEDTANQVRQDITNCFERLTDVLKAREKQLLRQVEAVHRQQVSLVQSNSALLPANSTLGANLSTEQEIIKQLRDFGKLELSNSIAVNNSEPYKAEEYQEASEDYVSFDKSLKTEAEEFDVTSVIRKKRDSSGQPSKNISINLNCTSCESCKFEADVPPGNSSFRGVTTIIATPSTSKEFDNSPVTPENCSSNSNSSLQSPVKENDDDDSSTSADCESPITCEKLVVENENYYFKNDKSNNNDDTSNDITNESDDNNSKKDECTTTQVQDNKVKDGLNTEHPIQIQQWLQQILAETETEPIIHEIGQFSKIPNTRLYREFPVET